jgi:hypothetical protein
MRRTAPAFLAAPQIPQHGAGPAPRLTPAQHDPLRPAAPPADVCVQRLLTVNKASGHGYLRKYV